MVLREKRDNAMGIRQASQENEWLAAKFKQEDVQRNRMSRDFIRSRQREFHARKQEYKVRGLSWWCWSRAGCTQR
jgi:hypothetical protein